MLSKFLDPQNDFAFKRVFGNERNKDILIHFLNDVVVFEDNAKIKNVTFLKTVQDPDLMAKKTSIVDVLCEDDNGHQYIVEMQVAKKKGFEKRAQYYAAKAYGTQLNKSEEYESLKPVLFIAITDFIMFIGHERYKSDHVILDTYDHEHHLQDLKFTFIELPKFHKGIYELDTVMDKWCYFFKHASETSEKDAKLISDQFPVLEKAFEELNMLTWSEAERNSYDAVIKKERDYNASMSQKFDEGKVEGKAEGKAEGVESVIKKMLDAGMSQEQIDAILSIKVD